MKPLIKTRLLLLTLISYIILLTSFSYTDRNSLLKRNYQKMDIYGELHGIDPTPFPPEPDPSFQSRYLKYERNPE